VTLQMEGSANNRCQTMDAPIRQQYVALGQVALGQEALF